MKLSVPLLGVISSSLTNSTASHRWSIFNNPKSTIPAVNFFAPRVPITQSVNPGNAIFGRHCNNRRRRHIDPLTGYARLRAGDIDGDRVGNSVELETSDNTSFSSGGNADFLSRGGAAAVAVEHEPGEEKEISSFPSSMVQEVSPKISDTIGDKDDDASHKEYAKKLKNRNHTNLSRKITHAGFGIFFACLNEFLPRSKFVPGMSILTSATLLMELLRYRKWFGWMNDALHFVLGGSLRKHEMEGKFTGSFYYFAGVTATSYLFPKSAATMGICQLALADPSASYFGRRTRHIYWSRIENGLGGIGRNKGVLGFLGGALFCFPFNYRVFKIARWGPKGIPGGELGLTAASLLLGLAGAFADLAVPTPALTMPKKVLGVPVPPFHVDDNFVVPIFSGFACTKIFDLLGWDHGLELARHIIF